jgi:hypothetical protein
MVCDEEAGEVGDGTATTLRLRRYRQEKIVQAFQKRNMGADYPVVLRCTALLW